MLCNCRRHMVNMHIKRCSASLTIHRGNATPNHCPPAKTTIVVVVVAIIQDDDTDLGRSWSKENHVPCRWKHRITPSLGETTLWVLKKT